MEYLLDTNIYRNIAETLELNEIAAYIQNLKLSEDKKGIKSGFSIVVAMELIQHLEEDDPHAEECYKALCLLVFHTQRIDRQKSTIEGDFYPPLNVILTKHFFDEDSKYLRLYLQVLDFAHQVTKNFDFANCTELQNDIKTVKAQVFFEKNELKSNIEGFLASMNDGTLDWKYFRNNAKERKQWFKDLASGHTAYLIAYALMRRAYQIMEIETLKIDAEEKFNRFYKQYYPALLMYELLLKEIGNGTEALSDVNDKRWNTINDISIMFGMLYQADKQGKIMVTEDKKIRECYQLLKIQHQVISQQEFFELLSLHN